MHVIPEPKTFSFEKIGIKGKIFPAGKLTTKIEFVLIETETGHETTIRENISDFHYYVLEGKGVFTIENQPYPCSKGDLIVVPAGKVFTYKGKLKLLLTVTPPWREEQEDTLA